MPVLSIGGDKANGAALGEQVKLVATNARSVVLPNTGHWIMEESPQATADALMQFLNGAPVSASIPSRTEQQVPGVAGRQRKEDAGGVSRSAQSG
jgi:hypothetical protein